MQILGHRSSANLSKRAPFPQWKYSTFSRSTVIYNFVDWLLALIGNNLGTFRVTASGVNAAPLALQVHPHIRQNSIQFNRMLDSISEYTFVSLERSDKFRFGLSAMSLITISYITRP
jgi:hypothetical protein